MPIDLAARVTGITLDLSTESLTEVPREVGELKEEVGLAKELHKQQPSGLESDTSPMAKWAREDEAPEGWREHHDSLRVELAQFSLAMKEMDEARFQARQWGNLRPYHMPDNTFRWLCPLHRPDPITPAPAGS